uniref:TPR_REGION domain-containing protein n=1 Tax=Trichobilharzia regenti TaxID=157069 RepID=A0AA85JGB5_TRIRE|nr:unnamed protein product [Trichobilharzia regenti]
MPRHILLVWLSLHEIIFTFSGTEHQKIDWVGIHEKICADLMSLRKPAPFIVSTDERKKKKEEIQDKNVDMVSLTQLIGQKLLFQGKPEEAVPAALQCLKFTADAYGLASVELVSPYLILAESSIGLGRLNQAETYLAQAQWTILKTQHECSNGIRSQLHRKLGLLYAAKGDYELALESLAKDIFYASCEYGTDHIRTAGGYFQMAEVFYAMHQRDKNNENLINQELSDKPSTYVYPSVTPRSLGVVSTGKTHGSFLCEEAAKHDVNLSKNSDFSVQMPMSKAQLLMIYMHALLIYGLRIWVNWLKVCCINQ